MSQQDESNEGIEFEPMDWAELDPETQNIVTSIGGPEVVISLFRSRDGRIVQLRLSQELYDKIVAEGERLNKEKQQSEENIIIKE